MAISTLTASRVPSSPALVQLVRLGRRVPRVRLELPARPGRPARSELPARMGPPVLPGRLARLEPPALAVQQGRMELQVRPAPSEPRVLQGRQAQRVRSEVPELRARSELP